MDERLYVQALHSTALDDDVAAWPLGDSNRGSALSGGQRARVALARALYSVRERERRDKSEKKRESRESVV